MLHIRFDCTIPRHDLRYRGIERVALLIGEKTDDGYTVRHTVMVPNRHKMRAGRFAATMNDAEYLLGSMVADMIGAIHSHPHGDMSASAADLAEIGPGYIGGVFCDGSVTAWYMQNRPLHHVRVSYRGAEWAVAV